MTKKRKICIVSSSRADYNHLFLLMKALKSAKNINFKLILTGMHLLKEHGETYKEIINDGFKVDAYIKNKHHNNSSNTALNIMSDQLANAGTILDKLKPDIIVVLGDRFDILPIVIACHIKGIAIAHFHGGELTYGAIDDAIRHAITKLSDIHFVGNSIFKKRVIQLGESPSSIFNIGSLGVLAIKSTKIIKKERLMKTFNIKNNYILISLHPETINENNNLISKYLFKVLAENIEDYIVFTSPNSDPGSKKIIQSISKFIDKYPNRSTFITSAGREAYINLVRHAELLIGNSSSCLIEAPALKTKSLIIGKRQDGRPLASSVLKAGISYQSIKNNIKNLIKKNTGKIDKQEKLSYSGVDSLSKILKILSTYSLKNIKYKTFNDQ